MSARIPMAQPKAAAPIRGSPARRTTWSAEFIAAFDRTAESPGRRPGLLLLRPPASRLHLTADFVELPR
jgi:hypothetical protein